MAFTTTPFKGVQIFEPTVFGDDRGYFYEGYNRQTFCEAGIQNEFVQDNQAKSSFGVVRGLHYQVYPYTQAKLVRVLEGAVFDIILDLREEEPTYGKWMGVHLSAENKKQLFVPRGFAHGYAVLSPEAVFFYKCDNYYSKAHEGGVYFNDPQLQLDWKIDLEQVITSEKDKQWPELGAHRPLGR